MPQRTTWIVPLLALASLFAGADCASSDPPAAPTPLPGNPQAVVMLPPQRVNDFSLIDQDGRLFRLSEAPGKVRVVYFGYTSCPDICPTTLWEWKTIKQDLGPSAEDVRFMLVTVDPGVDTPEVMKRFVDLFDPSFIGLTGSPGDVAMVWDAFGVRTDVVELSGSYAGHTISHSTSMYVLDNENMLRMKIPFDEEPADAARDIRLLLSRIPQLEEE